MSTSYFQLKSLSVKISLDIPARLPQTSKAKRLFSPQCEDTKSLALGYILVGKIVQVFVSTR